MFAIITRTSRFGYSPDAVTPSNEITLVVEKLVGNNRPKGTTPIIVLCVGILNIVIIRIAVNDVVSGIVEEDVVVDRRCGSAAVTLNADSIAIVLDSVVQDLYRIISNHNGL